MRKEAEEEEDTTNDKTNIEIAAGHHGNDLCFASLNQKLFVVTGNKTTSGKPFFSFFFSLPNWWEEWKINSCVVIFVDRKREKILGTVFFFFFFFLQINDVTYWKKLRLELDSSVFLWDRLAGRKIAIGAAYSTKSQYGPDFEA